MTLKPNCDRAGDFKEWTREKDRVLGLTPSYKCLGSTSADHGILSGPSCDVLRKALEKWKSLRAYTRSSKLYNAGRLDEALAALDEVVANDEYVLKSILHRASILHRGRRFPDAIEQYCAFLEAAQSTSALKDRDIVYLRAYAEYFLQQARLAVDRNATRSVSREEHIRLAKSATYLTVSEFMPAE